jgi:hypothetical protein
MTAKKTYWMFAIWENSRGVGESLRFHTDLDFDPRTLSGDDAGCFAVQMLQLAGVKRDEVSKTSDVILSIYDTERECSERYTTTRKQLGMVDVGRDPHAGVGRYGRS